MSNGYISISEKGIKSTIKLLKEMLEAETDNKEKIGLDRFIKKLEKEYEDQRMMTNKETDENANRKSKEMA